MEIYYLTSDQLYIRAYASYFEAQACKLMPYSEEANKTDGLILLLFSPFKCGKIRISPEQLWKKGLAIQTPNAVLLSAGFEEIRHPNYLDLLNLPSRFSEVLANSKRVSENWQPVYTGGIEMEDKLTRFFKGHGKDSLVGELTNIHGKISALRDAITEWKLSYETAAKEAFDSGYTWNHWAIFLTRWSYYYPLFQYTPFAKTMDNIHAAIKKVEPFFASKGLREELFMDTNCAETITYIQHTLNAIEKTYVEN